MNHVYVPVSNYSREVTKTFTQGEQIGKRRILKWLNEHFKWKHVKTQLVDLPDVKIYFENIDKFSLPLFKRPAALTMLDATSKGDGYVFFTPAWSACDAKDLGQLLELCNKRNVDLLFLRKTEGYHVFNFSDADSFELKKRVNAVTEILIDIGDAQILFRKLKARITHYRTKRRRKSCGNAPLGFVKNKLNVLIPDWDTQLLIRLIAYLRDHGHLGWAETSRRLAELYSKEGRHYPTTSKAKIPWSPQMCIKGYKAWKELRREDAILRPRLGNDANEGTVLD